MSVDYRPEYDPADVDSDYGHTGGDITVPTFTANMKPFRFWCQKALPLVYDDSLSYYEVLCKVVKQMNDFLTDLQTATGAIDQFAQQFVINQQFLNDMADQLGQNVQDLEDYINDRLEDYMTAYTQLQNYVNNYFDNLDVQQEINNKLDEMAEDGTFNTLFDPVITAWMTAKTAQIDAAIANQDAIQAQQNGRISVLEGRMDTFSALPSGSTSGNAELLDIRTNFLGETYPTAGDAVRASDMIASGFQSISATYLEEWDGNAASSVYDSIQIDVSGYKGGHIAVIGTFLYFLSELTELGTCSVYGTNTAGAVADSNAANYYPGGNNSIFTSYTQLTTSISGEERLLLQFAIPDDYAYQYLKIGNFEHGAHEGTYTEPLYIVYANSWSKTQVDPTLTIAGAAADAKAAGDAIDELNERLNDKYNIEYGTAYSETGTISVDATLDGSINAELTYHLEHIGSGVPSISDKRPIRIINRANIDVNGTAYNNSLPSGIVEGTVDINATGKVSTKYKLLTMDGSWEWLYSTATETFYINLNPIYPELKKHTKTVPFDGICDTFPSFPENGDYTTGNYVGYYTLENAGIRFSYPQLNGDVSAFKSIIDGVQVAYPLEAEVEQEFAVTNTPQVDIGTNMIVSNANRISVEYPSSINSIVNGTINELLNKSYDGYYYGEKFPFKKYGVNFSDKIIQMQYSGTPNDIAVYDKYLFVGINPDVLQIYDMETGNKVSELSLPNGSHCNTMCFGSFYDPTDAFPLLYVETEGQNGIYNVLRISTINTITTIKQYKFSEDIYGTNPQIGWDFNHSLAFGICRKPQGATAEYNFFKFDLTNETVNEDGTYTPAILTQGVCQNPGIRQGSMFYADRLYMMVSNVSDPYNPHIIGWNCSGIDAIISTYMSHLPFSGEGEGLAIWEDSKGNSHLYVSDVSGAVFELSDN